jgi:hypothetical protein
MAQAVRRRLLTAEAWVSPCGFMVDKVALGHACQGVLKFYPVNIIPPWFFMRRYHLADEQQARWWPQFRDIVSPH